MELRGKYEAQVPNHCTAQFVQASFGVILLPKFKCLANHRVLPHQHHCLATEFHANILHLLRTHMVDLHKQGIWSVDTEVNQLSEVGAFFCEFFRAWHGYCRE